MGKSKTIIAVSSAIIASALQREGIEIEVAHLDDLDQTPDFKEVRTDPAFRREKTHPTSFRKHHK